MKEIILQHIYVHPEKDGSQCLFAREKEISDYEHNQLLSFDTYYNSFSYAKWKKYTNVNQFYYRTVCKGSFCLKIYSINTNGDIKLLFCKCYEFKNIKSLDELIEPFDDTCLIYCQYTYNREDDFEFYKGYYYTKLEDVKYINVAGIMCTYNREKYLRRNVLSIMKFKKKYLLIKEHFKFIVVDNASNIDIKRYERMGATVFHNINSGGSGGFTRGMMEALKLPDINYVLLLDDDIYFLPETIFRIINFLSLLRDEYKEYFLGGAMFSLDQRNIQRVYYEKFIVEDADIKTLYRDLDMCRIENIIFSSNIELTDYSYSGWWMCCIPTIVVKKMGFSLPFFVKADDIEYSLRNKSRIIRMNSICVWHQDFALKLSYLNDFYWIKNRIILSLMQGINFKNYIKILNRLTYIFLKNGFIYNYNFIETIAEAINGIGKGAKQFNECTNTNKEIFDKLLPLKENFIENKKEFEEYLYKYNRRKQPTDIPFITPLLIILTLNGHLLPQFLIKNKEIAKWWPGVKEVFGNKNVIILDPVAKRYRIYTMDRKKFFGNLIRFSKGYLYSIIFFKKIKNSYINNKKLLVSEKFWKKFLEIE